MVTYLLCAYAFAHTHTHTTVRRWNCMTPIAPDPNCLADKHRNRQHDNPLHPFGKRDFPQTGNEPVVSFRHSTPTLLPNSWRNSLGADDKRSIAPGLFKPHMATMISGKTAGSGKSI